MLGPVGSNRGSNSRNELPMIGTSGGSGLGGSYGRRLKRIQQNQQDSHDMSFPVYIPGR